MKLFYYLSVILLVIMLSVSFSKEVKSTEKGGEWYNKKTWVGGKIPSNKDDVVINGDVFSKKAFKCFNLSINKNGSFKVFTDTETKSLISGDLYLYGCLEIHDNSFIMVEGKIVKESDCLMNEGSIQINNWEGK